MQFFTIFFDRFSIYLAPSGAKYCEKGLAVTKLARVDRQTHFGTFNFWVKPGLRAKTRIFSYYIWPLAGPNIGFIGVWKAVSCLKPTSEKAGIGLRRENFEIPESRILKPSFLWFLIQLGQFWTTFAVTHLLQDLWASLSIPADPGRVFHPVWRPKYIFI